MGSKFLCGALKWRGSRVGVLASKHNTGDHVPPFEGAPGASSLRQRGTSSLAGVGDTNCPGMHASIQESRNHYAKRECYVNGSIADCESGFVPTRVAFP